MYDAAGIRRASGKMAVCLNKIMDDFYKHDASSIGTKLKELLGVLPDVTTHTVENAIYQLRKNYGHDFIQNTKGKYKIGRL